MSGDSKYEPHAHPQIIVCREHLTAGAQQACGKMIAGVTTTEGGSDSSKKKLAKRKPL
jgi:hypothetical protein